MSIEETVILVPCQESERVGCGIARRAVERVATATPEVEVRAPEECPRGNRIFVVAIDGCSACQASSALKRVGVRAGAIISAPAVLARAGLAKPGVDLRARAEWLADAVAAAVREAIEGVLAQMRERQRYQEEMAAVMERFQGVWSKIEVLPSPDGAASETDRSRVDLLAKRARNIFAKFDEIVPPGEWSEPHDLFQDALLCLAYACEGWTAGDVQRWEQNLEKARVQIRPLLRRLQ